MRRFERGHGRRAGRALHVGRRRRPGPRHKVVLAGVGIGPARRGVGIPHPCAAVGQPRQGAPAAEIGIPGNAVALDAIGVEQAHHAAVVAQAQAVGLAQQQEPLARADVAPRAKGHEVRGRRIFAVEQLPAGEQNRVGVGVVEFDVLVLAVDDAVAVVVVARRGQHLVEHGHPAGAGAHEEGRGHSKVAVELRSHRREDRTGHGGDRHRPAAIGRGNIEAMDGPAILPDRQPGYIAAAVAVMDVHRDGVGRLEPLAHPARLAAGLLRQHGQPHAR